MRGETAVLQAASQLLFQDNMKSVRIGKAMDRVIHALEKTVFLVKQWGVQRWHAQAQKMSVLREAMLDPKPMVAYADTNIESVLASAAYMLYTDALQAEARASGKKAKPSLWGRDVCVIAYKPKRQRAAVLTSAAKDAAVLAFARGALSGDVRFVSTGGDLFQHLL